MAIVRIPSQDAQAFSNSSNSVAASYPVGATTGNLLIAAVSATGGSGSSITIIGWTQLAATTMDGSTGQGAILYKLASGGEFTVTANGSTATNMAISIFEYAGNANPIATDGSAGAANGGGSSITSLATTSITTFKAADLIITAILTGSSPTNFSWTTATLIGSNTSGLARLAAGENIVSSTQSGYTDTASWSGASTTAVTVIGAFVSIPTVSISSDTITTSESLSHYSDQVDVGERIVVLVTNRIVVSDSVSTSDSINLSLLYASDTTITSENTILYFDENIVLSDSSITGELATVLPVPVISISDTVSLSDNIRFNGFPLGVSVSDIVSGNESIDIFAAEPFDDVETLTLVVEPITIVVRVMTIITIDVVIG